MQVSTGRTFSSLDEALKVGIPATDLVEITGTPEAVESVSRAVRDQRAIEKRRAANKVARKSRRANRQAK
jgi:hypothetical protein